MKTAALLLLLSISRFLAQEIETLRMEPAAGMTRAELHFVKTVSHPKAVLILCPGVNGSGEKLIRGKAWQEFARENNLGLVGLSFASLSSAIHNGTGYYYASKGSGEKLLEGIRRIYGKELPILLYGFSGGAQFTSRFEEWRPEKVFTWCAYSAGWWDSPVKSNVTPPGIIACGDEDHRYGASLVYFKQGRAAGKPWLWVSLPKIGHTDSSQLDEFVRNYFSAILKQDFNASVYADIDQEIIVSKLMAAKMPSVTTWLPSLSLLKRWMQIHEP